MVMVEMTLNYNSMWQVLGWRGRFWFPAQLIPTIIGICGLLRVLYVGFLQWRSPEDAEPSLEKDEPIDASRRVPTPQGKAVFRLFASRTLADARNVYVSQYQHKDGEMDPLLEGQPAMLRYLASYLPWIVLVRWWHLSDEEYEWEIYENPNLQIKPREPKERSHSKNLPRDPRHASWGSDEVTVSSPRTAYTASKDG